MSRMNIGYSALIIGLLSLSACNEDSASRDRGSSVNTTQGATASTILLQPSQIARTAGTQAITTNEEISKALAGTLGTLYRSVPDMTLDDEKYSTTTTRPVVSCGLGTAFKGSDSRIKDCAAQNSNSATWLSINYGKAGEGSWKLVAFDSSTSKEIWKDLNTGLLWSDTVITSNWCKASGNHQGIQEGVTVDCQTVSEQISFCENLNSLEGMTIKWRLPTRNDFLQADLNGARFILKNGDNSLGFWTATVNSQSTGRSEAWVYTYGQGLLASQSMTSGRQIRCVGAAAN